MLLSLIYLSIDFIFIMSFYFYDANSPYQLEINQLHQTSTRDFNLNYKWLRGPSSSFMYVFQVDSLSKLQVPRERQFIFIFTMQIL